MRIARWPSLFVLFALACAPRPTLMLGNDCEFATQCPTPLVCRLGHCRDECRLNRDCRVGLVCLRDPSGLGACELPDEDRCVLNTDCAMSLVCLMGHCSEACMRDVDCPVGATCASDATGHPVGCRDAFMMECEYNTDCAAPLICAPDHRCREQCHTDRDCRDGLVCDRTMSPSVCGLPHDAGMPPDAASIDTGVDAGMDDTGIDGGMAVMTGPSPIPMLVSGEEDVCGTIAGQLRCWGAGNLGEIGDNGFVDRHAATPLALTNVTMLAAGSLHTCAYSTTSGLRCWGEGSSGQIGDGLMMQRGVPTTVNGALVPTWIAGGGAHTCAVSAGNVLCWGSNATGELGDGSTTPHPSPTPTLALAGPAVEVTARGSATCARLMDGRVQCWGDDRGGQLGVNLTSPMYSTMPLLIAGVSNAVEVVLGSRHACARRVDGVVLCWGNDSVGQLGDAATGGARLVPAPTAAMPPAVELAAAADHMCARAIDGDVYCWGDNFFGQCGRDPLASPTAATIRAPLRVPGVSNAMELATGDNQTCARIATGFVCWGENARGQLGDTTVNSHFAPMPVGWP